MTIHSLKKEKSTESESTIKVGIIGAGYWGPNLIRNFRELPECTLVRVCDKSSGRLNYIHQQWPELQLVQQAESIIQDSNIDAVVIATPVSTHGQIAEAALEAGKHVFVEKPFTRTTNEACRLIDLAASKQLKIATGHIFVHHPAVTKMKETIKQGEVGDLCYAESSRVNLGPPASEVDVIWDLAVHDISILLYLWEKEPVTVTAFGRNYLHPHLMDTAFIHIGFADGTISQHHVSWLSPEKVRSFFVAGSQGSMKFDDAKQNEKLRIIDQGIDSRIGLKEDEVKDLYYRPGKLSSPDLPILEPLREECRDFLKSINNGHQPKADGQAGMAVVKILEAAEKSIAKGNQTLHFAQE